MRMLSTLLILAMIGVFIFGCQDTTIAPRDNDMRNLKFSPVSANGGYLLYSVGSAGDALSTVNVETGEITLIGPLDPQLIAYLTPVAMAVRSCDGAIFVWNNSTSIEDWDSSAPDGRLLLVDPCTGYATPVDSTTEPQGELQALACHPDGRLFGTSSSLVEIDPVTGIVTTIGSIGLRIAGADFHPVTGVLYGAELGGSKRFGTIDIETGAFTQIATLDSTLNIMGTIAFDPAGEKLYGTASYDTQELFEIDPATGATFNHITITGAFPQGMGFGPLCGEDWGDCGQIQELTLVIKPGGCPNPLNPKSKGVLPMALLGESDFDIETIDLSSLEINGVHPLRSGHEDIGGPGEEPAAECDCSEGPYDGILDLTLKFSTQEIVATLGTVSRGDVIELTLTGTLNDGTPITASECVVIVGK